MSTAGLVTCDGSSADSLTPPQAIGLAWRRVRIALEHHGSSCYQEDMKNDRVYKMSVASVYPHYVAKAERNGRTKAEVDEIIRWLTGYTQRKLESILKKKTDFETFFAEAPKLNPSRKLITGVICGIRVEEVKEPLMREIRYLDKLIEELARGKAMEKILRKG